MICFVTIRIFARTEQVIKNLQNYSSFVTIRIFARTEHKKRVDIHRYLNQRITTT